MPEPVVTIEQGTLRGSVCSDFDGGSYFSFRGIPFGKPPVGQLRFKAPEPAEKWTGEFDATKDGSPCYARDMMNRAVIKGSEDCLVLNVFTKQLPTDSQKLKPVMVWIHGGGFMFGSNDTDVYSPDFLITQDIVIVSINYRLGLLGFLRFSESSLGVPGNAAFKDMILGLKWVQKNVSKFGGDPKNVTIFGESAGAASVHYLMLSPMSEGLFHKVIAQSGSALCAWATTDASFAKEISELLGNPGMDEEAVLSRLREMPVEEILSIQEKLMLVVAEGRPRPVGAVIETTTLEPTFLRKSPIDIILNADFHQVPFMTGHTTGEGMCFEFFLNVDEEMKKDVQHSVPRVCGYAPDSNQKKEAAAKLKKYYFGDKEVSNETFDEYMNMLADLYFVYDIHNTVRKQVAVSREPTYLYRMSVESKLNFFKINGKLKGKGVSHADDIGYLFKTFSTPKELTPGSVEEVSMRRFVKLWTNFAIHGNPTPIDNDPLLQVQWKPVTKTETNVLEIGTELRLTEDTERTRLNFLSDLYKNSPAGKKFALDYKANANQ